MKKLKIWQIILLVIFYPVGIVYFLYWLYRTRLYANNPQPPLKQWQIWLYSLIFPIGVVMFIFWLSKTNFCTQEPTGGALPSETAYRCKRFFTITSIALVIVCFLVFAAMIGGDSGENDDNGREGTFETTTAQTPSLSDSDEPFTTTAPEITETPATTTREPVTTPAPETTEPLETTKAPETTRAPSTTKNPSTYNPSEDTPPILPDNPETNVSKIELISVTSPIGRNEMASLTLKGKPNTEYKMAVKYSSDWSSADGLGYKTSDADGYVTWTWKVGGRTTPGEHPIKITCDDATLETSFVTTE